MKDMLKKVLALCLCLMMLCSFAVAEGTDEWLADETVDEAALNAGESSAEEEALMAELAAMIDDPTREGEVDLSDLSVNGALPDHVVNILLIGIDNRSVELESGRADANIICSINKETGAITLTSIGRDTAVKVPGYKSRQRLNTAFKYGSNEDIGKGAELAMKTVNVNFQMNIQRYVLVNIHGLADIIQALGGVDMYLTAEEAKAINYELFTKEPMDSNKGREKLAKQDGVQHLDGMQAVTYGRIRNLQGQNDLNRNSRQRVLLETLLKTVMQDMDVMKLMTLIQTALPYGRTNLTLDEMLSLGMAVLGGETMKKLSEGGEILQQFGIPVDKQYAYKKYGEVSLLYINPDRLEKTLGDLHMMIYGESYYNPELFPD
ncbi:MAG: LCP family protein [bacterium]|nr:LCP family protein [bacterium]